MSRQTGITLKLASIVLGIISFMPGEVRAGDPGSQNGNVANAFQYCLGETGDTTYYRQRPRDCKCPNPIRDDCTPRAFTSRDRTDSAPVSAETRSGGGRSGGVKAETVSRQAAAIVLSLMMLGVGLLGIVFSVKKLLSHLILGLPTRHVRRGLTLVLHPRAVGLAGIVAVVGLASGAWLTIRSTNASGASAVQRPAARHARLKSTTAAAAVASATPVFSSALQISGSGSIHIGGTAIDPAGNTYVAGGFNGIITFNTSPQPTEIVADEGFDAFVAKYDAAGQVLWARVANGATGLTFTDPDTNVSENFSFDGALAVAVDSQGNAYVGGGFVKSLTFKDADGDTAAMLGDDAEAESDEINYELFVAKYSAAGTLLWARGGDSGSLDDAEAEEDLDSNINGITDIVLDQAGNPYVAGTFTGNNFLGEQVVTEGGRDVLLSRLNPATGDPAWVSTPGSTGTDAATGLAVDNAANVYLIGDMGGTITFPTEPSPTTLMLEDEFGDAFIAKYNSNGQPLFAKQIGGTQPIDGTHIAVTGAGEIYLTGAFAGEAEFDSITLTDPSQGGGTSGFLTKYTTGGNAVWARVFGRADEEASDGDTIGYRVAIDAAGSPYVSGIFEGETTFGQETPSSSQTLLSGEAEDEFVAHYDAAGNFLWVKQPDESGGDVQGGFLSSDSPIEVVPMRLVYNEAAKAIILTGDFQGTLKLDDITLNSGDARHAYIAAIAPPHPLVISEFRFRGPDPDGAGAQTGERDEFVELYNESNAEVDLGGWALAALDTNGTPAVVFNFPTGAIVPARGHYLLGGADYSLGVTPDGTLNFDIPDGSGIALFYVGTTLNASTRVDAAGFASVMNSLYREGAGLTPGGGITEDGQHTFVRKLYTGVPQDTGNNETDFLFVSTNAAAYSGRVSALGAPGPESTASHVQRNAGLKASLIDPQCAGFGAANSACARVRVGDAVPNGAFGTMALRRKFTNTTGAPVMALRFRVVDITTQNSPGFVSSHAILRVLSSGGVTANGGTITITGATLETSPSQPNGGGYNSALAVALPGSGLADGDSINVEFLLGVEQNGNFRFYVNVEAIPGLESASSRSPSNRKTDRTKATGSRKQLQRSQ